MPHRVASLGDIPPEGVLSVTLPSGRQVCLVRHDAGVSAFADACTHQGMPLSAGEVLPDGTLQCAWHGARFDVATGEIVEGPATDAVESFNVELRDDGIWVGEPD